MTITAITYIITIKFFYLTSSPFIDKKIDANGAKSEKEKAYEKETELEKQKRINAESELSKAQVKAIKARRESSELAQELSSQVDALQGELSDAKKKAASEKKVNQRTIAKLEKDMEKRKLTFDANTAKLQKNCDNLLGEFTDSFEKDKEDALAEAMKERVQQVKLHGEDMRRMKRELSQANIECRQIEANAAIMANDTAKQVTNLMSAQHKEKMKQMKIEAKLALRLKEDEIEKLLSDSIKANEEREKLLIDKSTIQSDPTESIIPEVAKLCLGSKVCEMYTKRQSLSTLGIKVETIAEMNRKSRKNIARLLLCMLDKVIESTKAGKPDTEGLMDEIVKLPEFKKSPLARLMDNLSLKDSAVIGILSKAYKSAVRSEDKVTII